MRRQALQWEVGREKVIGVLVEAKKKGKRRVNPVLDTVGSTAIIFWIPPYR